MANEFSPMFVIANLIEAKPVMAAAVAGLGSMVVMDMNSAEALAFGSSVALGTSLGDALLTGLGFQTKVQAYLGGTFSTYVDPMDFVGAAVGSTAINFAIGARGQPLLMIAALSAVAGGVAPKVSGYILSKMSVQDPTKLNDPTQTSSVGVGGHALR